MNLSYEVFWLVKATGGICDQKSLNLSLSLFFFFFFFFALALFQDRVWVHWDEKLM